MNKSYNSLYNCICLNGACFIKCKKKIDKKFNYCLYSFKKWETGFIKKGIWNKHKKFILYSFYNIGKIMLNIPNRL